MTQYLTFRRSLRLLAATSALMLTFGVGSALAADPDRVSFTLEGCRLPVGATTPASNVCPDAQYTTGNLGKSWNELDLVPYRITADNNNGDQTYTIAAALDAMDSGAPGYDVISAPVLNLALSTSAAACQVVSSGEKIMSPGMGGIDETRYREWTITQLAGATCVWDYYGRLALGSHLFPGSSLHGNKALIVDADEITSSGIGAADVSIPVKEIAPQTISKTMSASQGSAYTWGISKTTSPTELNFGNTCEMTSGELQATVTITVRWTRTAPSATGDITLITDVTASNPAHREITVTVSDSIYKGSGQAAADLVDTEVGTPVDVPANTSTNVLHHETTVPAGTATQFNDVATATYTDKVTGIPVPGTSTATASASVVTSNAVNSTATVSDSESITGDGLTFSTDSVSTTPVAGEVAPTSSGFNPAYTLGTAGVGPVVWQATVAGSGQATFSKTVYLDEPRVTTGALTDTATVNDGTAISPNASASASVPISSTLDCGSITIVKDAVPDSERDFAFTSTSNQTTTIGGFSLDDDGNATLPSTRTFSDLKPGSYSVTESGLPIAGWTLTGLTCSDDSATSTATGTASIALAASEDVICTYANTKDASVQLVKVTDPASDPQDFAFSATGGGLSAQTLDTDANSATPSSRTYTLSAAQQAGAHSFTEALTPGWSLIGSNCTNTTEVASDDGRTLTFNVGAGDQIVCTYTNTKLAELTIRKVTDPAETDSATATAFTFTPSESLDDATFALKHDGTKTYVGLTPGTTHSVVESLENGYRLVDVDCGEQENATGSVADRNATVTVAAGDRITCTFTNKRITAGLLVVKVGSPDVVHDDEMLTFNYAVTNPSTSNGSVRIDSVDDDKCPNVQGPVSKTGGNQDDLLDPGETWNYTCSTPALHSQEDANGVITNTVTVTGRDEFDNVLVDRDNETTKVIHPAILIDKSGPATAQAGDRIDYALEVTNPGDTGLAAGGLTVNDPRCDGAPALVSRNGDGSEDSLDPGDRWSYTCTAATQVGDTQVVNVATVCALDALGKSVCDEDDAVTTLAQPQQLVLPERIVPGTARLIGPTGCVGKVFRARVSGTKVARVVFTLDGKRLRTLTKPNFRGQFAVRINPAKMRVGVHRLRVVTTFQRGSGTRPKTMNLSFQRCARKLAAPRFTG